MRNAYSFNKSTIADVQVYNFNKSAMGGRRATTLLPRIARHSGSAYSVAIATAAAIYAHLDLLQPLGIEEPLFGIHGFRKLAPDFPIESNSVRWVQVTKTTLSLQRSQTPRLPYTQREDLLRTSASLPRGQPALWTPKPKFRGRIVSS
jgi:hypothetical protein